MGFRINSTGRKRLLRENVQIILNDMGKGQPPTFTADIRIPPELKLDLSAKVYVEPYVKSSSMRFDFGTVGQLIQPPNCMLSDIDVGAAVLFRIKVVDETGEIGRILASANGIRPESNTDGDDRKPLLPVITENLGEELWQLEIDRDSGPALKVNSRIPDLIEALKRDPILQGAIYPEVVRNLARALLSSDSGYDDDEDWVGDWKAWFESQLGREVAEGEADSHETTEALADEITSSFAGKNRFATNLIATRQQTI